MADSVTSEELYERLQTVIRETEALLQASASFAGEKVGNTRERAGETLRSAKARLADIQDEVSDRASDYIGTGRRYVRSNPWQSIGIAAGIGLVLGALLIGSTVDRD
ncbi:MAG TPA: DUF883 family protein [Steroidobacteraceae bacterium]|jgi:ElaB/YqjD/DUF883 family membrane-anchored ribosome-binding protein|nr:DUF883 family protein [Steroidobacteraceae bacterium]